MAISREPHQDKLPNSEKDCLWIPFGEAPLSIHMRCTRTLTRRVKDRVGLRWDPYRLQRLAPEPTRR
jgi:hypothetical protein